MCACNVENPGHSDFDLFFLLNFCDVMLTHTNKYNHLCLLSINDDFKYIIVTYFRQA